MTSLLSALLPLLFLGGLLAVLLRGRPRGFRPRAAMMRFRSPTGPLMATWLALVAATWGLLDAAAKGWLPLPPTVLVTVMVAAVVGLVVAERVTLFVLALAGLAAQLAGIAEDHGLAVAIAVIAGGGLVTWLFGAARGLLGGAR